MFTPRYSTTHTSQFSKLDMIAVVCTNKAAVSQGIRCAAKLAARRFPASTAQARTLAPTQTQVSEMLKNQDFYFVQPPPVTSCLTCHFKRSPSSGSVTHMHACLTFVSQPHGCSTSAPHIPSQLKHVPVQKFRAQVYRRDQLALAALWPFGSGLRSSRPVTLSAATTDASQVTARNPNICMTSLPCINFYNSCGIAIPMPNRPVSYAWSSNSE